MTGRICRRRDGSFPGNLFSKVREHWNEKFRLHCRPAGRYSGDWSRTWGSATPCSSPGQPGVSFLVVWNNM